MPSCYITYVSQVRDSPEPPKYIFWYHNDREISYDSPRGGVSQITEKGDQQVELFYLQHYTIYYTVSTPTQYLHNIYTVSTQYLHSIYTISTQYLHSIYRVSTQYLQNIYTLSTQYLHNIYTGSTTSSFLLVQHSAVSDSGRYSCQPSLGNTAATTVHVIRSKSHQHSDLSQGSL